MRTRQVGMLITLSGLLAAPLRAQEEPPPAAPPSNADEQMAQGGMTEERTLTDEQARAHFRAGRSLYDLGRFRQAAQEFEEAYRLSQRPELLFNAYVAFRDANDLAGAVRSLGAYLDLVQDAPDRVNLQARLASMSEALEQQRAREAELEASRNQEREPRPPAPPPGPEVWPWGVMGVGAAMLVAGAVTGGVALAEASSLAGACQDGLCRPEVELEARRDTAKALGISTDVLLFGGGAVTVLGLVLGLVLNAGQPSEAGEPAVSASCGPTGCAASLRARF